MAEQSKQEDTFVHVASDEAEAVYYAVSASMDELAYPDKMAVIISLAKCAMLKHVEDHVTPASLPGRYVQVYAKLCDTLAANVMELPDHYVSDILEEMEADQKQQREAN